MPGWSEEMERHKIDIIVEVVGYVVAGVFLVVLLVMLMHLCGCTEQDWEPGPDASVVDAGADVVDEEAWEQCQGLLTCPPGTHCVDYPMTVGECEEDEDE